MRIFISHKFQGINKKDLRKKLEKIISIIEKNNHQAFVYFRNRTNWRVKNFPPGKVIKESFWEIKKCDAVVGFIDRPKLSEGMLLEIGFAKALNKKIILLISGKYSFPTLEAISDRVIKFNNLENLSKKLKRFL